MTCTTGTTGTNATKFRLEANGETEITADAGNLDICNATKILERLHTDFTESIPPMSRLTIPSRLFIYETKNIHRDSKPINFIRFSRRKRTPMMIIEKQSVS